jgi:hypothetical protein
MSGEKSDQPIRDSECWANEEEKRGDWQERKEKREEQSELSFPLQIMNSCKNRKIWQRFPLCDTRIPYRFSRNRPESVSPVHITPY